MGRATESLQNGVAYDIYGSLKVTGNGTI